MKIKAQYKIAFIYWKCVITIFFKKVFFMKSPKHGVIKNEDGKIIARWCEDAIDLKSLYERFHISEPEPNFTLTNK